MEKKGHFYTEKISYIDNLLKNKDFVLFSPKTMDKNSFDSSVEVLIKFNISIVTVNLKRLQLSIQQTPNEFFKKTTKTACLVCFPKKNNFSISELLFLIKNNQTSFIFLGAKHKKDFISMGTAHLLETNNFLKGTTLLVPQSLPELLEIIVSSKKKIL